MVGPVNDAESLAEIQRLARLGRVRVTRHAADRMDERGVKPWDLVAALVSSTAAIPQSDRGAWRAESTRTATT